MNKNAEAVKNAYARKEEIAVKVYAGALELEVIEQQFKDHHKAGHFDPRGKRLSPGKLDALYVRQGGLEDAQQELPAEAADLQKYIDRLLDPEGAWPVGMWDDQERRLLCAEQRANISRYTGVKKFL
jgi:hypothetical protein